MPRKKRPNTPRLDDLEDAPYNPRGITDRSFEGLGYSLEEFGDLSGITWNRRTGHLVTGHQRLRSLKERHGDALAMRRGIIHAGDDTFRVRVVDWPIAKEKAANIAANSPAISGDFTDELPDLITEVEARLPDLAAALLFDDLVPDIDDVDGAEEPVPDLPAKPVAKPGELWTLGDHRILCADAREPESFAALVGDRRGRCLWTDPPYGVAYVGKTKDALELEHDDATVIEALLQQSFAAVDGVLDAGAAVYVAHPPGKLSVAFGAAFIGAGWRLHQTLVWVKDSMVLGHSDYQYRHEPILYGYRPGPGRRGRGGAGWYGGHSATSIFEYPKPHASRDHPTSKPVRLVAAMLRNSTEPADLVIDPFLGSGSTVIACEQLGRACYGMEIDPRYVDVVVQRWQTTTGRKAKRKKLA